MAGRIDYGAYLASREWALKKEAIRERSGGICERCHNAPYQETHHKTYAHIGNEPLDELLAVCSQCHQFLSGKTDNDPKEYDLAPTPLPFHYPSSWGEVAAQIGCPVCRFEYVHLDGVEEIPDTDDYEGGWVRGGVIRVKMYCESGHRFVLEFGFHKGNVFMRVAPKWSEGPV